MPDPLLSQCYEEQAEYKKRFKALDKYCDMTADYYDTNKAAEIIKDMADEFYNEEEYKDAQKHYELLIKKYPKSEVALLRIGEMRYSKGSKIFFGKGRNKKVIKYAKESIKAFRKFLKLYPESKFCPEAQLYVIRNYYFLLKDHKQTTTECKKLKEDYPESESAKLVDLYIVPTKNQGGE
ncbi:MAG: outer membrane protein assembly factor BamD [Candidatus Kappaea frigidicola]|nr:outer membrane protein assembly factor BamD [Candidatus Kappaea frigidicola]